MPSIERYPAYTMYRGDHDRRGPGYKMYDEYVEWRDTPPVHHNPCGVCRGTSFTLSGTCLTCKRAKDGLELFINICHVVGGLWWSNMDDSTKRFAMMELK